ncbi:MAG: alkene reductase [Bdellovibrionales bacterium]|nr:alkene reductase [Bdellovibrionales bacterium]
MSSPLLQPVTLGALKLRNRIFLAPLTRSRASGADGRTPNELMRDYYVQRASAGLIFTEATAVTPMGVGYANTPGIWSPEHVAGWKMITDAVHAVGGKMVMQLWHVGRVSHPMFLNGELPVAPSALAPEGHVSIVRPKTAYVVPRALETSEIPGVVAAYRTGAENAKLAGFDGVEIHGANGYLLDQFLHDGTNQRTDSYGGPIANRARLMLEVTDACIAVWGADRVGMHLSPRSDTGTMSDSNPAATFGYVAEQLGKRKIAFICAREYVGPDSLGPQLKKLFGGMYVGNEQFTAESAEAALARGDIDAVAFGRDFLANPDLVKRIERKAPLNAPVPSTFYAQGALGYTDYPFMKG